MSLKDQLKEHGLVLTIPAAFLTGSLVVPKTQDRKVLFWLSALYTALAVSRITRTK